MFASANRQLTSMLSKSVRLTSNVSVRNEFLRTRNRIQARSVSTTTRKLFGSPVSSIDVDKKKERVGYPQPDYIYGQPPSDVTPSIHEKKALSKARLAGPGGKGPEPSYAYVKGTYSVFESNVPFQCEIKDNPMDGILPKVDVAYETWGELNTDKTNAILLYTGASASSHAKSTEANPKPGWWERFIGPGLALDTNKYFVICSNVLGGCFGSTGPSSTDPDTNEPYGLSFPMITLADVVRAQFLLLDHLGIYRLHAAVGASMGGMCSLAAAAMFPHRVSRVVSISAAARAHPTAIALRYMQRRVLMSDPHWSGGEYYGGHFPVMGMKHAREIATISYRSGPEWDLRFGRKRTANHRTSFEPEFLIETYLDHQGNSWINNFDPNSFLYISKATDLFDLSDGHTSLRAGLSEIRCPTLVIGVQSDILFPIQQQRELVDGLKEAGNEHVSFYELNAMYGHDTFLLEVNGITGAIRGHL
eukprot:m.149435 g.149435  ORF g.149435 m.149435 type:complete len:475 (-) comp30657_c0_seq1:187-1611(-)